MAGNGPLPDPKRRRVNAPTIPTTNLPAGGRPGPAPRTPKEAALGPAGRAWWRWAWSTPQAAAWDDGSHQAVLRRARLEDMVRALEHVDWGDVPSDPDELPAYILALKATVSTLKGMSSGTVTVMREMRELDDRLGLTPKAMAQLRWSVVPDAPAAPAGDGEPELVSRLADRRRRLADAS